MSLFKINYKLDEIKSIDSDYALFVGNNYHYYRNSWLKLLNENGNWKKGMQIPQFNWIALSLFPLWLSYRKMYAYTAIYVISYIIITAISPKLSALFIGCGFSANQIYLYYTKKSIDKIHTQYSDKNVAKQIIKEQGGVNKYAPIVVGILLLSYIYISFKSKIFLD